MWLATDPPEPTRPSYEDFRLRYNRASGPGQAPLAPAGTIETKLQLPWRDLVQVVRDEADYHEACEPRASRNVTEPWVEVLKPVGDDLAVRVASPEEIAHRLAWLRRKLNWSQANLAERSGVAQDGISKIESGLTARGSVQAVTRLAVAMHVSLDLLVRAEREEFVRVVDAAAAELSAGTERSAGI